MTESGKGEESEGDRQTRTRNLLPERNQDPEPRKKKGCPLPPNQLFRFRFPHHSPSLAINHSLLWLIMAANSSASMLSGKYAEALESSRLFLSSFSSSSGGDLKYLSNLQDIANRKRSSLIIDMNDLYAYDPELCESVKGNTKRYMNVFAEAADAAMPPATDTSIPDDVIGMWWNSYQALFF